MKIKSLGVLISVFTALISCKSSEKDIKISNQELEKVVSTFITKSKKLHDVDAILLSILNTSKDTTIYLTNSFPSDCQYYIGKSKVNNCRVLIFSNNSIEENRSFFALNERNKRNITVKDVCEEIKIDYEKDLPYEKFYLFKNNIIRDAKNSNAYIIP